MPKNLYTVAAVCSVCSKKFMARVNIGKKAKTCTPPDHVCRRKVLKRAGLADKVVSCVESCCRSRYRKGAMSVAMDNTIDPRKVLSDDEFEKVWKATKRLQDPEGMTLRFIAKTGCRLGEALLVRKEAFFWQDGPRSIVKIPTLKKKDKGRPPRSVHIKNKDEFTPELRSWWKETRPGEPVFLVARRTLQRALEKILEKVKPERESLIHILRHTRASQLLAAGASPAYVRHQMGWSSIELAKIYAHVQEDELDAVFANL